MDSSQCKSKIVHGSDAFLQMIYCKQAPVQYDFCVDLVRDTDYNRVLAWLYSAPKRSTIHCDFLVLQRSEFPVYIPVQLRMLTKASRAASEYNVCLAVKQLPSDTNAAMLDTLLDFVNNAPIGLQWLSPSATVLWANQCHLDLLGYTAEELVGKHITEFSCDTAEELENKFSVVLGGGNLHSAPADWKTKDGDIRHILIDSNIRFGPGGKVRNTRCFIKDNTAVQIQNALKDMAHTARIDKARAQDRFLRKVLHEIKTPCSNIMQSLDSEKDADTLKQLSKLVRIVKDVDDADAFENGKVPTLQPQWINVIDIIHAVRAEVMEDFALNPDVNSSVLLGTPTIPSLIYCDQSALHRILSHLLGNAFRFTHSGIIEAEVSLLQQDEPLPITRICIRNTGTALDKDYLHQVSQKYWHQSSAEELSTEQGLFGQSAETGIGLGLNICCNLLQCMGSDLQLTSENGVNSLQLDLKVPTQGTTVSSNPSSTPVKLSQLSQSSLQEERGWIDVQESDSGKMHVTEDRDERSQSAAVPSIVPYAPPRCKAGGAQIAKMPHVLVVDDNLICLKVMRRTLEQLGCTVAVACNGEIAVKMFAAHQPPIYEVIFMDCRMPICDGFEATKLIRAIDTNVPIIAFSADNTHTTREECKKIGMNNFLGKPATQKQISEVLRPYMYV